MTSRRLGERDAVFVIAVLVLLAIVLSRSLTLNTLTFDEDEIRTIMRSSGTPPQVITWQPDDWPPLYDLLLSGWRALTGSNPVTLRFFSVLFSLMAAGLAYRVAHQLFRSHPIALTVMLGYSALGYSVFLSTYLRAYVVVLALFPLALWLLVRYFDRPAIGRGSLLGVVLSAMFYLTYTSVLAVALLGLYSLIRYPRRLWRWWLPGGLALVLILPQLQRYGDTLLNRAEASSRITPILPALPAAIADIYGDYAGPAVVIWGLLFLLAFVLIVRQPLPVRPIVIWSIAGALLAPLVLYILAAIPLFYYFSARYSWWALLLIAFVLAVGLARLPTRLYGITQLVMLGLMFVPLGEYTYIPFPLESVFTWLSHHKQPGDVMVIDPNFCVLYCPGANSEENKFEYYKDEFAPDVSLVDAPGDARRIWYLSQSGWNDESFMGEVSTFRVAREFVGPWNFLLRVYEGPPDREGVPFSNGLRFHGIDILRGDEVLQNPIYANEQETLRLRLWWSVDEPLDQEYSVAIKLVHRNIELVSLDGAPQLVELDPTAGHAVPASMVDWEPGRLYVEERALILPASNDAIRPSLYLTVYQWWDGLRLQAPGLNEDDLLPMGRIRVWGF